MDYIKEETLKNDSPERPAEKQVSKLSVKNLSSSDESLTREQTNMNRFQFLPRNVRTQQK